MKLTVDFELTNPLLGLASKSALAYLLSKSTTAWLNLPLEALVCNQFGLGATPDHPLAAVAAKADGLNVADAYWLRADPVHLILQRDSFSLGEQFPLQIEREQAESLVASLNLHFSQMQNQQDHVTPHLKFFIGHSGAWYLRLNQVPKINTTLPAMVVGKSIFQFMPQGDDSATWRAYLNEVQMLLHTHPINLARESSGEPLMNSLWLSGGGAMPTNTSLNNDVDLVVADSAFYRGLAQWSGLPCQPLTLNLEDISTSSPVCQHVRLQLARTQCLNDANFYVLLNALKTKKIKVLTLNIGFFEKTLTLTMHQSDTFKFWRKSKPVMEFFGMNLS